MDRRYIDHDVPVVQSIFIYTLLCTFLNKILLKQITPLVAVIFIILEFVSQLRLSVSGKAHIIYCTRKKTKHHDLKTR